MANDNSEPTPVEGTMGQAYQIIGMLLDCTPEGGPLPDWWQIKVLDYFAANKYDPDFDWSLKGEN